MRDPEALADLPEALPLRRVAPLWRVFALLEAVALVGLLLGGFVLLIALFQQRIKVAPPTATMVAPPVAWPPTMAPAAVAVEETADPSSLPYPTKEDLRAGGEATPAEPNLTAEDKASARDLFLAQGEDVWRNPRGHYPSRVSVSPDGKQLAYIAGDHLAAGAPDSVVELPGEASAGMAAPPVPPLPRGVAMPPVMMAGQTEGGSEPTTRLAGVPAWSDDGRSVYVAHRQGAVRRYDLSSANFDVLPEPGSYPVPLPGEPRRLVLVRWRPTPKLEGPGAAPAADLSEVVLINLQTKQTQVLIPASPSVWKFPAVSADGKQLALVSDRGEEAKQPPLYRTFVLDIADPAKPGTPRPLGPAARVVGPVCWTPDGSAVVYARSQDPVPPDARGGDPARLNRTLDLFAYDLAGRRETRLSRGGGFYSPSVARDGTLFYLTWEPDEAGQNVRLRRMPLTKAREFAAEVPGSALEDVTAWTALAEEALKEAGVPPDADGSVLTPETLAKLADVFGRLYRERFRGEGPATAEQFDRTVRTVRQANFPDALRGRLDLLLGAAEGEYLRHRHAAAWHLAKGPLSGPAAKGEKPENPFGYLLNPFQLDPLVAALEKSEGRTLILTNDPAAGQAALAGLVDPDLVRGTELFQQGKADEAEKILLDLLAKETNARNAHLGLQVAQLLYEHQRRRALRDLVERLANQKPFSARKFNLQGLINLKGTEPADPDAHPQLAVEAFKNALRCDLHYGPAYLNLAQAYSETGNARAARQCLERYLHLMPDGPYAEDARRRLGAVASAGEP